MKNAAFLLLLLGTVRLSAQLQLGSALIANAPTYSLGNSTLVNGCDKQISFSITNTTSTTRHIALKLYIANSSGVLLADILKTTATIPGSSTITFNSGYTATGCTACSQVPMNGMGGTVGTAAGSYRLYLRYNQGLTAGQITTYDLSNLTTSSSLVPNSTFNNFQTITINPTGISTAPTSLSASPNPVNSGNSSTLTVNGGSLGYGCVWKFGTACRSTTNIPTTSTSVGTGTMTATTTYYVWANHCNSNSSSTTLNTTCASNTIAVNCNTPNSPSSSGITTSGATINWSATTGHTYTVQYKATTSGTWITASSSVTGGSYTLTGLTSGTTYNWQVSANCNGTWLSGSNFTTSTSSCSIPSDPPAPNSNSPQSTSVTITRNGTPPSGITWYWQTLCSGTSTTDSGATYTATGSGTYYLRAYNPANGGCWSSGCGSVTVSVTGSSCTPPNTPTGLSATAISSSQINLSWSSVSGATAGYDILDCSTGNIIVSTSNTSYSHTGLNVSTSYSYKVRAKSSSTCVSSASTCASAATQSPTTVNCGNTCGSKIFLVLPLDNSHMIARKATFKWEHELGRNISVYKIEIKDNNNQNITVNNSKTITTKDASDADIDGVITFEMDNPYLNYSQTYTWQVKAYDPNGNLVNCSDVKTFYVMDPPVNPSTYSCTKSTFGEPVGSHSNVVVYKNGCRPEHSKYYSICCGGPQMQNDYNTSYNLMPGGFQCLEYVRRYFKQVYNTWIGMGHAITCDARKENWGFKFYNNNATKVMPKVGDILTQVGLDQYGHVSIIKNITSISQNEYLVYLIHQNVSCDNQDLTNYNGETGSLIKLKYNVNSGTWSIPNKIYKRSVSGWLRAEPLEISPGSRNSINQISNAPEFIWEKHTNCSYNLFVKKYNASSNCYEDFYSGSGNSVSDFNGIKNKQFANGEKFKWRIEVIFNDENSKYFYNPHNQGRIMSRAKYFQMASTHFGSGVSIKDNIRTKDNIVYPNGSELANASISMISGSDTFFIGKSADKGIARIFIDSFYGQTDTIMTSSRGYYDSKMPFSSFCFLNQKINIPLFSSLDTFGIINPKASIMDSKLVVSDSVHLKVTGKGYDSFSIGFNEYNYDSYKYSNQDSILAIPLLDTGINSLNYAFYSSSDTVFMSQSIYNIPSSLLNSEAYKISINNTQNLDRISMLFDGQFICDFNSSISNFNFPRIGGVFTLARKGYRPISYRVDTTSTINFTFTPIDYTSDFNNLNFNIKDNSYAYTHKNVSLLKQSSANIDANLSHLVNSNLASGLAISPISRVFNFFTNHNFSNTNCKVGISLDQPVYPKQDSTFLLIVRNDSIFDKKLLNTTSQYLYDSVTQKLTIDSLNFDYKKIDILLSKKLSPIITTSNHIMSEDEPKKFALRSFFSDPDLIPNDMQFFIDSLDTNITAQIIGDSVLIAPKLNYFGNAQVHLSSIHDWLKVSKEFTLNILPVNDTPILAMLPTDTICSGYIDSFDLSPYNSDVDNIASELAVNVTKITSNRVSVPHSHLSHYVIGHTLYFKNKYRDSSIQYEVELSINDGQLNSKNRILTIWSKPTTYSFYKDTICANQLKFGHNKTGIHYDTLLSAIGCDSVRRLDLHIKKVSYFTLYHKFCSNMPRYFNGHYISKTGTYYDTFVARNQCDSILSLVLVEDVTPRVSRFDTICEGQSVIFKGQTLKSSGILYDTLTTIGGCDSFVTYSLYVNPTMQIPIENQNNQLLVAPPFYKSYQWYLDGFVFPKETNFYIKLRRKGVYKLIAKDQFGCYQTSDENVIGNSYIGLSKSTESVAIYPNPSTGDITIETPNQFYSNYKIYNLLGQVAMSGSLVCVKTILNLGSLVKGIYNIEITDNNGKMTRKFIIKD